MRLKHNAIVPISCNCKNLLQHKMPSDMIINLTPLNNIENKSLQKQLQDIEVINEEIKNQKHYFYHTYKVK